jgi:hypothetical protein
MLYIGNDAPSETVAPGQFPYKLSPATSSSYTEISANLCSPELATAGAISTTAGALDSLMSLSSTVFTATDAEPLYIMVHTSSCYAPKLMSRRMLMNHLK